MSRQSAVIVSIAAVLCFNGGRSALAQDANCKRLPALQDSPSGYQKRGDRCEGLYVAKVKVLGEYVHHHVKEEEGEIFPKARKSKLDLVVLGEQLQSRKQELQSEEQMLMPAPRQARSAPTRRHAH